MGRIQRNDFILEHFITLTIQAVTSEIKGHRKAVSIFDRYQQMIDFLWRHRAAGEQPLASMSTHGVKDTT